MKHDAAPPTDDSGRVRHLPEELVMAALLGVMVMMVTMQVASRYVFHSSLSFTEEIVRYLFVWMTFLGIGAALKRRRHLSIAGEFRFIPHWMKRRIRMVQWVCAAGFSALLIVFGLRVVFLQIETHQTTAVMGMPMWIIGLSIPVCSALVFYRLIESVTDKKERNR